MEDKRPSSKSQFKLPNLLKINRYAKKVKTIFKENPNLNSSFCLNIKLSSQMKIILEIYSEENPTNLFYKSKLSLNEFHNLHSFFDKYNDINDIYEVINVIINKGLYDIKFESNSNLNVYLILYINNMQIKIHLNKEKIFFQQNDLELNEFINEFYNEFLNLKETFESQINQKNEEIKKIKEENKEIQFKLEEMKNDNNKLSNKLKEIKENITEKSEKSSKDNSSKKNTNFEPKKEEIISQPDQYQIDLTEEYQYPHSPYMNNNPYYYYLPHYYNNSGYNYTQDYFNNNISNTCEMDELYDYYNNNEIEDIKDENKDKNINNITSEEKDYNNIYNYDNLPLYPDYQNIMNNNIKMVNPFEIIFASNNNEKESGKENINNSLIKNKEYRFTFNFTDFNRRYQTQIKDNQIKKLDLGKKHLGNDIISE